MTEGINDFGFEYAYFSLKSPETACVYKTLREFAFPRGDGIYEFPGATTQVEVTVAENGGNKANLKDKSDEEVPGVILVVSYSPFISNDFLRVVSKLGAKPCDSNGRPLTRDSSSLDTKHLD